MTEPLLAFALLGATVDVVTVPPSSAPRKPPSSPIGSQTHMNRSFGMQRAGVLTWSRVQSDPYDEKVRDKAEEEIWAYSKALYSRYRSATLHTASHKFKVPRKVWQALSVTVAVIFGV